MAQQTAMELLFIEFEALSESSRKAGDEKLANLIDFLCQRKNDALSHEARMIERIRNKYYRRGWDKAIDFTT